MMNMKEQREINVIVSVRFYVTKFDSFLFKSQHSFHNFLILHGYDLTITINPLCSCTHSVKLPLVLL